MARQLRIQYPGALYHITHRGNARQAIFHSDSDRVRFLELLPESVAVYGTIVHAFVLMDNHFHLLVETPLANLSEFMRHFNIRYTGSFNHRHGRVGNLYQGRYKSVLVDKETYLAMVSRYIHLNPVKVQGLDKQAVPEQMTYLLAYPWSSLPGYLDSHARRYDFVTHDLTLAPWGGDTPKGRRAYHQQIIDDLHGELPVKKHIVAQSLLGSDRFLAEVKERYLDNNKASEQGVVVRALRYKDREKILAVLAEQLALPVAEILSRRGENRQIAMHILYQFGGLKNQEIGDLMGLGYSAVSQGRKRLREQRAGDAELHARLQKLEQELGSK